MLHAGRPQGRGERRARAAARIDFATVNAAALRALPRLLAELLPGGRRIGAEWRCGDLTGAPGRSLGVRLSGPRAGAWCDFATGARGGDPTSLAAAVWRCSQSAAARRLARVLGLEGAGHG